MLRSIINLIAAAANRPGAHFEPFDPGQLLGNVDCLAPAVTEYFSTCVLVASLDLPHARILSSRDLYAENKSAIPSFYCVPHGFITIATTDCGDAIALDVIGGRVYLLSHEKYESDGIHRGWNADCSEFLPPIPVTRDSIISTADDTWESIEHFLVECLEANN